jgi:hypothetical protein
MHVMAARVLIDFSVKQYTHHHNMHIGNEFWLTETVNSFRVNHITQPNPISLHLAFAMLFCIPEQLIVSIRLSVSTINYHFIAKETDN